jgi:formylglycine-generating enzyme required for sulfatase activity
MIDKEKEQSILYRLEASLVLVEGGTFMMGCTKDNNICHDYEKPSHKVTLSNY